MKTAVIVAHGQPSDPEPAAAEIAALAAQVARHLPGWQVLSATLAEEDALPKAVRQGGEWGVVYPLFMAGGWFTRTHLPERLAAAGGEGWVILPPFGMDPAVQDLAVTIARETAGEAAHQTQMILAAHGSFRSPAPAEVAKSVAELINSQVGFARVEPAYIDQDPRLVDLAKGWPTDAFVLPFFAARGGHVIDDLPQALAEAGFEGRLLPPIGLDPRVPGMIAQAINSAAKNPPILPANPIL